MVFGNIVLALRKRKTCASGSVGGARPCQGRGRGFESRLALFSFHKKGHLVGCPFFVKAEPDRALHPRAGIEVSAHVKCDSVGAEPGSTGPRAPSRDQRQRMATS